MYMAKTKYAVCVRVRARHLMPTAKRSNVSVWKNAAPKHYQNLTKTNMQNFQLGMIIIFENYVKEKMAQKEKEGFIITREIVEEIFKELRESIENRT